MESKRSIFKCKMNTKNTTHEDIIVKYPELPKEEIAHYIKFLEKLDNTEVVLGKWDDEDNYYLIGWSNEVDPKIMDAMYHAEQINPMGVYRNDHKGFLKAWEAGEYDPGCSMSFEKNQVEVIEKLH